jgi:hypothetical protein
VSLRGLLALVLALAAVVALVYFLKPPAPKTPDAGEDAPLVPPFLESAVRGLELRCGESPIVLERAADAGWRLVKPLASEADPRAAHVLVAALQDARIRKVISAAGADAASYGLSPPECAATVTLDGASGTREVRLGRTSPVGVERYARDATGRIVFVDGSLASALGRSVLSLREKRLVPVEPDAVVRIELTRPAGPLVLAKEGDRWRLLSPDRDAAAASACEQLARSLTAMELHDLRSTPIAATGPADRRIAIKVQAKGRADPIEAFVATAGVGGGRLAWREGGAIAGLLSEAAAADLVGPSDRYRDDHVASFSAPEVRSLTIERGGATIRVERAGEGAPWTAREGDAAAPAPDKGHVDALVDSIRWLKGSGFLPAPPDSPATGTIVVRAATRDLARLRWGSLPPASGGTESVWIESDDRPGVAFRVAAASFGPIPSHATDLAPTAAAAAHPEPGKP